MSEPNDINQDDGSSKSRKHKAKHDPKRLGRLATLAFMGMSFLGGFIGGGEVQRIRTPPLPPPPTIVFLVQAPQEIRNLSEDVRSILKRAADKKISVEDAVVEISAAFKITLSNIGAVEQLRRIVQRAVDTATDESIQEQGEAAIKVLESMSKSAPSPLPTATIVFPSRR
jgi:plasmid stability protein